MPIYEYECTSCGHRYEKMVKMGADAPPCPECASGQIRKLVSRSGFILQGGGWYKDHYGLKSGGDSKSSDAPKPAASAKSEGAKSDGGAKTESAPAAAAPKTESAPKAAEASKPATKTAAAGS